MFHILRETADGMPNVHEMNLPFRRIEEVYKGLNMESFQPYSSYDMPSFNIFRYIFNEHCPYIKIRKCSKFGKFAFYEQL